MLSTPEGRFIHVLDESLEKLISIISGENIDTIPPSRIALIANSAPVMH